MDSNTPAAFGNIADLYYQPLFRFALSLCGTWETASDLTQQTFYLAFRRSHQLREPSKMKPWLFSILFREFLQRRRHDAKFHHHPLEACEQSLPVVTARDVSQLDAGAVMAALNDLPDPFRLPLALFYLEDKSYKEIAGHLGIPIGTVMSRIARGKAMLRQKLEPRPQLSKK